MGKRPPLRPTLADFWQSHLILTAVGALLTVILLVLSGLLGWSDALYEALPTDWAGLTRGAVGALPALLPLLLCLLAYVAAGRATRRRAGLPRPGTADALILLLAPSAAFWFLLGLSYLIPHGAGLVVAAVLLNCPAYGLFLLWSVFTGWSATAPAWADYVGGLCSGLLPPLLFLLGRCLPIKSIDRAKYDFIDIQ